MSNQKTIAVGVSALSLLVASAAGGGCERLDGDDCTVANNCVPDVGTGGTPSTTVPTGDGGDGAGDTGTGGAGGDPLTGCAAPDAPECGGTTPVCDEASGECRACRYHDECDAACNVFTGACLTATPITVSTTTPRALEAALAENEEEIVLLLPPRAAPYIVEETEITGAEGKVVAILGQGAGSDFPTIQGISPGLGTDAALTVDGGSTLLMEAVSVSMDDDDVGVSVGGRLALDRVQVTSNPGGGISATNSSELLVRNSIIAGNGNSTPAISLGSGTLTLLYSSVAGSFNTGASAVACLPGNTIVARNSILFSEENSIATLTGDCDTTDITFTAFDGDFTPTPPGMGNKTFSVSGVLFQDLGSGDLRLTDEEGRGEFADEAIWQDGDPPTDIDGDARPTAVGTMDVAGAHLGPAAN